MNWSTSVVSSTSTDTDPTVLITFENARYIFNVGENTSRTFLQSRNIWRKARAVFLSQICAERSAGLPGFLMTMSDSGLKSITIGGPDGLDHFIASLRLYTHREDMSVSTIEHPRVSEPGATPRTEVTPMYKDENITVFAVQATPEKPESSDSSKSPSLKRKRSGEHPPACKQNRSSSPTASTSAPSTSIRPSSSSSAKASTRVQEQRKIAFADFLSLIKRMQSPSFTPHQLVATDASAWRKLTIEHMFGTKAQGRYDVSEKLSPTVLARAEAGVVATKEEQANASNGTEVQQPSAQNRPKRMPSPANSDKRLPYWKSGLGYDQRAVCSYIIHGPKVRGKFDANKAAALGLKPGPLRGKVAKGETVEIKVKLPDGTEVTRKIGPDDCLCSPEKPLVLCVVDCPDVGYIDTLVSSPAWKAYHPAANKDMPHQVHLIYHLVGDDVLEDVRYKTWMKTFGDHVHHLVANRNYCPDKVTFTSVSMSQLRLHNLDRDMFPLPHFASEAVKKLEDIDGLPLHTQVMDKNHHTSMRPLTPPKIASCEFDKFHEAVKADPSDSLSPGMKAKFEEARAAVDTAQSSHSQELPGSDVTIIPFGTSSASPTKYRNVSATLVQIPSHGSVLLDCGEGTYGQLSRHFGPQTGDVLRDLRCIFISHIHADHHIGLSKLLTMRRKLNPRPTQPLYLVAFRAIHLYLWEYSDLEDLGFIEKGNGGIVRINADTTYWKWRPYDGSAKGTFVDGSLPSIRNSELALPKLREALGLDSFVGVDVAHRTRCFGLVMRHKSGWSLVYSGDTMPCNNLVEAGKDATLLIHEATMSDDQAELAAKKAHSTCGQAIDIAKQMQAQNVLLTHFSARHPKMPPGISTLENLNVGIAFDQMRLSLNQVWKLATYQDAIQESFSDMKEEEEDVVITSFDIKNKLQYSAGHNPGGI